MIQTTRRDLLTGAGALGLTAAMPAWAFAAADGNPADTTAQTLLSAMAEDLLSDSPEAALTLGIDKGPRAVLHGRFMDRSTAGDLARAARCTTRLGQLRKLGASCDWDRTVHTLDAGYSQAVLQTFVTLYERGYVYRGKRMVNWCPVSQTGLSDEEVIMKPSKGSLYRMRYGVADRPITRRFGLTFLISAMMDFTVGVIPWQL